MDDNAGTEPQGGEAPTSTGSGTPTPPDEVTTLRNRNAGLDAKVTELLKARKAAEEARDAALTKLSDYETGKVKADEALSAQLAAKDAELLTARRETQAARIAQKYPETFGTLGEAAIGLSEEVLAATEARMAGQGESPNPVGNNPERGRAAAAKNIEDMTADELRKHLASFDPAVLWTSNF